MMNEKLRIGRWMRNIHRVQSVIAREEKVEADALIYQNWRMEQTRRELERREREQERWRYARRTGRGIEFADLWNEDLDEP